MPLFLFFLLFVFTPAFAQEDKSLSGLEQLCNLHHPEKSGAEYVPGMDVHGNSVVPADLHPELKGSAFPNNPVVFPITIDLAKRYGLDFPGGLELDSDVSTLTVFRDGRMVFGKQDVSASVKSGCEDLVSQTKKKQSHQEEQHRHESSNPVLSSDKIEGQYP
ncbi:MAG: hypothetical protein ACLFRA_01130 [Alphaproteobacteria bacterium]